MTDHFQHRAEDWDANDRRTRLASAIGAAIRARVQLHDRMRVLDFGAGTGLLTAQVAPLVQRVVALDTSPAMLAKLEAKEEFDGKVATACQDLLQQPLDDSFDLVVSAMSLHHVEDTARLLQRFNEQLSPGGSIALADLDEEDGSFHPPGTEGVYHSGFDRDELRKLLETHGFENVEFTSAHTIAKDEKDYPVFLVTARKA